MLAGFVWYLFCYLEKCGLIRSRNYLKNTHQLGILYFILVLFERYIALVWCISFRVDGRTDVVASMDNDIIVWGKCQPGGLYNSLGFPPLLMSSWFFHFIPTFYIHSVYILHSHFVCSYLIATSHLYVVFRTAQRVLVNRCFNRLYWFTCNVTVYTMRVLCSWDTIL